MSKRKQAHIPMYVFLTALALFMGLPLVYMVSAAFKPLEELFLFPPRFFVRHPTVQNFGELVIATSGASVPFIRFVFNSLFTTVVSVAGCVIISSLAAYPLAKHKPPGGGFIFAVIIAALMFAPEVTQIPRYLVVNRLKLIDSFGAIILPNLALPLGLFLMKQFMEQIPDSLIEATRMDGGSELEIFRKIIIPLSMPALATVIILTFITVWNDTFGPISFLRSDAMKTLPLAIQTIAGGGIARSGTVAAGAFLTTMPIIVVFLLLQRRVLETMAHSGIKA